ncbi:DUF3592 domain-containing protein [Actinoplanes sp. NPDC026619]|uniref:DUF3592 domain-containing protein n=1 Tax=Actinoplanes sp. NPDC026619 TaxID=3155798 RepID=UPI0033D6A659
MVLGAVLVLVGAFVLYRGVREMLLVRRLRRDGRAVAGTVTGYERRSPGSRAVVVSYPGEDGVIRQLTSSVSASVPTMRIGEPATVRYLPGEPESAWLDVRRENTRTVLLTVIIGFGFAAGGMALAVKND